MVQKGSLCLVIIGLMVPCALSKQITFYRKDYTYVKEYDAFYKMHWDEKGVTWDTAFKSCNEEGAKLFYPSGEEWNVVKNLSNSLPEAPNTTEIFVGLHDQYHIGEFITVDGKPTETPLNAVVEEGALPDRCVLLDYITGQFKVSTCNLLLSPPDFISRRPFVCKRIEEITCPTIDHEYKYEENEKKCFKVNRRPKTWAAAMQTCYMEGGILAILHSNGFRPSDLKNSQYYFVGIKKMHQSSDFYTVKGDVFVDDGFKYWCESNSECQNYGCGVIFTNNGNDIISVQDCDSELPFVCEMTVE